MTCPYCKKEVTMSAGFCPECGLSISKKCDTENLKTYWNRINSAREKYLLEKEKIILNEKKEKNIRITKAVLIVLVILLMLGAGAAAWNTKQRKYEELS